MSDVIELNDQNFDNVLSENDLVLVDFYADWCGPCRVMSNVIDQLSKEYDGVVFAKLNVDNNILTKTKENISGLPTISLFKNNKKVYNIVGLQNITKLRNVLNIHS